MQSVCIKKGFLLKGVLAMFKESIVKNIMRVVFFVLLSARISYTAEAKPVVYFSDMTDGPTSGWNGSSTQGAAVSIWGQGFGSSGSVTCCGIVIASTSCAEWAATTNPTTARGLQRITF